MNGVEEINGKYVLGSGESLSTHAEKDYLDMFKIDRGKEKIFG